MRTALLIVQSFWNFAQSTAVILPCSVQNFKMIGLPKFMFWVIHFAKFQADFAYLATPGHLWSWAPLWSYCCVGIPGTLGVWAGHWAHFPPPLIAPFGESIGLLFRSPAGALQPWIGGYNVVSPSEVTGQAWGLLGVLRNKIPEKITKNLCYPDFWVCILS